MAKKITTQSLSSQHLGSQYQAQQELLRWKPREFLIMLSLLDY